MSTASPAGAAWVPCPCCPEWWCERHQAHVADCDCPPTDEWETDPYSEPGQGLTGESMAKTFRSEDLPTQPLTMGRVSVVASTLEEAVEALAYVDRLRTLVGFTAPIESIDTETGCIRGVGGRSWDGWLLGNAAVADVEFDIEEGYWSHVAGVSR